MQPQTPDEFNSDHIIEDEKSLAIKQKVMARQKTSSFLNSISKAAMYLGGVLSTAAIGAGLGSVFHGAVFLAAFSGPVGIALAIGAAIIAVGIATDYAQSRIWQSCTFDNLEANADSTARHLVRELKGNNMCMVNGQDSPCAARNDWAKRIKSEQQAALQQEAAATSASR
jgi:hypothetical protein